jgi:hypothetical protein
MAWAEPRIHSSGPLSPAIFAEVARLRLGARTIAERAAVYRLETIAIRLRNLEALGERILSAVKHDAAPDGNDPPEIPDFLRRY